MYQNKKYNNTKYYKNDVKPDDGVDVGCPVNYLNNLSFCFTGEFKDFKERTDLQDFVKFLGGKIDNSIKKTTNYLITTEESINNQTVKYKKAVEAKKNILNEQEFYKYIEKSSIIRNKMYDSRA